MKQISFSGCEQKPCETVGNYRNTVGRVKCWGALGAFWGGMWGWMFGSTFLQNEGEGPLRVVGPMMGWMTGAVEGGLMGGGLSAVWACVFGLVMQKSSRVMRETSLNMEELRDGSRQS